MQKLRALTAAAAALAYFVPVATTLLSTVPPIRQEVLDQRSYVNRSVPVEIRGLPAFDSDGTFFVHRIHLHTRDPERLTQHLVIALLVNRLEREADLQDGELRFGTQDCVYRTSAAARFPDRGQLEFVRSKLCSAHASGEILVRLRFRRPARPALLTLAQSPDQVPADAVLVSAFSVPSSDDTVFTARGMLIDPYQGRAASRLSLLAYLWNVSMSPGWIVVVIATAAGALAVAALVGWPQAGQRLWRQPVAGFCAALAFAVSYAVLVPPFEAADEPMHFVALAEYYQRPDLTNSGARLAMRGHYSDIHFNGDRHFTPADREAFGDYWTDVIAADPGRGTGVTVLWKALAPVFTTMPAPFVLLAMRVVHAVLFALSVAAFLGIVRSLAAAREPAWLSVPLFLVPTLPYFGTYMTNYAPLVGTYVVCAAAVAAVVSAGRGGKRATALMAAALAASIVISRSALPLIPVFCAVACAPIAAAAGARLSAPRVRALAIGAAVGTALLFAGSLVIPYPTLASVDPKAPPPVWSYVWDVVKTCATLLRFGTPDHLTSVTFWGGFGWLETLPPLAFIRALATISGLALIALFVSIARQRCGRTLAMVVCLGIGLVLSAGAYAYSVVRFTPADLHGRYLLGLYVCGLVVAWAGTSRTAPLLPSRWHIALSLAVAGGCVAAQTYCLCLILRRYF